MQPLGFIHAPTNLGLSRHLDGRERQPAKLAQALAQSGLIESIGAIEVEMLAPLPYPDDEQWVDKTRNVPVVREFTLTLADAITKARGEGFTPLVCGGDCSVVLGCGVALARTGRYALVFLDAHHDYHHPGNAEAFNVAGADLAIVTGSGTDLLTNIESRRPYFRRQDVLLFGFRSEEEEDHRKLAELQNAGIGYVTLEDGRTLGTEWVGRSLADSYEKQPELDGFWIHLDADVLDPSIMPAVDCPEPGGLTADELTTLLRRLVRSPRFAGMDVTILDPDLDRDGGSRRVLTDILTRVFTTPSESFLP